MRPTSFFLFFLTATVSNRSRWSIQKRNTRAAAIKCVISSCFKFPGSSKRSLNPEEPAKSLKTPLFRPLRLAQGLNKAGFLLTCIHPPFAALQNNTLYEIINLLLPRPATTFSFPLSIPHAEETGIDWGQINTLNKLIAADTQHTHRESQRLSRVVVLLSVIFGPISFRPSDSHVGLVSLNLRQLWFRCEVV